MSAAAPPRATIRASRRKGHAVVVIERQGRKPRRHQVTLHRYALLREWTLTAKYCERRSGAWMRSSFTACLWDSNPLPVSR
jgi:hypothetical protein